ncbi:MAG TPA: sulfite exporter TauE/SafE family protein [Crocinitomix sp.]|nr:sulfite exporter TauE/SafE family protein [Crocinitomix sp.]
MNLLILVLVSFGASWLTFFCGFGLGTMLTPVFYMLFGDLEIAIFATTIVHFLNNVFKFLLMKKSINWQVAIPFGLAAIPAAFLGAWLLTHFDDFQILSYQLFGKTWHVMAMNLVFGIILSGFALVELIPSWSLAFSKQKLWVGGFISGFFGGLSGHQGALRTAFLVKYKLEKNVFIATGIVVALVVDIVRSTVYFSDLEKSMNIQWSLIIISLSAALIGAITGRYFLQKIKLETLNIIVSIAMLVFGVSLALGFLNK